MIPTTTARPSAVRRERSRRGKEAMARRDYFGGVVPCAEGRHGQAGRPSVT